MNRLLCHDTVMLTQPLLVKHFGRAGAQLLSQLHYWLTKKEDNWVYNTAEEWAEQLQLSVRHVRRLIAKLASLGVIKIAKLSKIKTDRTNYYSIDYDCLAVLFKDKMAASSCQKDLISIQKLPGKDINKSTPSKEMLRIWNECLGKQDSLNQSLAPLLVAAFKLKFESNFAKWQSYCEQIKAAGAIALDLALKFATIDRMNMDQRVEEKQDVSQMIDSLKESDKVKALRYKIVEAIGAPAYISWFHQAQFCDGKIGAPNGFVEQYWETNFEGVIRQWVEDKFF